MAELVKGDVVVLPFPFSDLSASKRRPALVLATPDGDDVILCQITSQLRADRYSVALAASDFQSGRLVQTSNIRPNKVFTGDRKLVLYTAGRLRSGKVSEVVGRLVEILHA